MLKFSINGLEYFLYKETVMDAAITEKESVLRTVQNLPEDASIEEAMERLYLLLKVEKGCCQADSGKTVSHVEAEKRMKRWLK
jgi:hypothetical protein